MISQGFGNRLDFRMIFEEILVKQYLISPAGEFLSGGRNLRRRFPDIHFCACRHCDLFKISLSISPFLEQCAVHFALHPVHRFFCCKERSVGPCSVPVKHPVQINIPVCHDCSVIPVRKRIFHRFIRYLILLHIMYAGINLRPHRRICCIRSFSRSCRIHYRRLFSCIDICIEFSSKVFFTVRDICLPFRSIYIRAGFFLSGRIFGGSLKCKTVLFF